MSTFQLTFLNAPCPLSSIEALPIPETGIDPSVKETISSDRDVSQRLNTLPILLMLRKRDQCPTEREAWEQNAQH